MPTLRAWCPMGIKTNLLCATCSIYHIKDYANFGDYNEDGVLQSFCPRCGYMHPPVYIDEIAISTSMRRRKKVSTILSMRYNISFDDMRATFFELKILSDDEFVEYLSKKLDIESEEIIELLQGSGNIKRK